MLREVGNGDAYMQSGYLRSFGGCSRLFTEHDRDGPFSGVFPFRRVLSACTSATQTHSVYFDSGCLCSRLGYAFVVMDTTE